MGRILGFGFGLFAYLLFFAVFLYLVGFVGNLLVTRSIDIGPSATPAAAVLIDLALIALFGVQHSVMARPGFKAALTRSVPAAIERSVYVLAASAALIVLFIFWQPLPTPVWSAEAEWLRVLLWVMFGAGWLIVFISTWLINHFELFGLRQVWANMRGHEIAPASFRQPLFYKAVRHPIYAGFLLAFWATPDMSVGHLLFAVGMTVYILIGIRYEERDLGAYIGQEYTDYRQRVGMLIPGLGRARR